MRESARDRPVDFLGIGAQKAATTWLHLHLVRHPQVWFPGRKETHFWDRRDGRGGEEWLAMFADAPAGTLRGEITPAYATLDAATIHELAAAAPGLRVFYSLRNPMERAWSAAMMALERAELSLSEASDAWFLDHLRSAGSRRRGDYAGAVQRWRGAVGEEALLVLFVEEIRRDPQAVLVRLAEHLGIDPDFYRVQPAEALGEPVFSGPRAPIRPSLRPELLRLYREPIAELEALLDVDLGHWRRFEGEA